MNPLVQLLSLKSYTKVIPIKYSTYCQPLTTAETN